MSYNTDSTTSALEVPTSVEVELHDFEWLARPEKYCGCCLHRSLLHLLASASRLRRVREHKGYLLSFLRDRNACMCCCGSPVRNERPNCSTLSSIAP